MPLPFPFPMFSKLQCTYGQLLQKKGKPYACVPPTQKNAILRATKGRQKARTICGEVGKLDKTALNEVYDNSVQCVEMFFAKKEGAIDRP